MYGYGTIYRDTGMIRRVWEAFGKNPKRPSA